MRSLPDAVAARMLMHNLQTYTRFEEQNQNAKLLLEGGADEALPSIPHA